MKLFPEEKHYKYVFIDICYKDISIYIEGSEETIIVKYITDISKVLNKYNDKFIIIFDIGYLPKGIIKDVICELNVIRYNEVNLDYTDFIAFCKSKIEWYRLGFEDI